MATDTVFRKVKSGLSRGGQPRDTYSDGSRSLVVRGTRGALVDRARGGAIKCTVLVAEDIATVVTELSSPFSDGYMVQSWLDGGE